MDLQFTRLFDHQFTLIWTPSSHLLGPPVPGCPVELGHQLVPLGEGNTVEAEEAGDEAGEGQVALSRGEKTAGSKQGKKTIFELVC